MHTVVLNLALALLIRPLHAQQVETSTVVLPASTVMVATTLTSYSPDFTVTVTPTVPASPQYTSPSIFIESILNSTNFYRWEHNASFLAWNSSLANYATNWANQCNWAHSHGAPGENLARGYPDVISAVDAWGDERALYNYTLPTGFTEATGHFTQLVWKATQTVGCAAIDCQGRNDLQGWYLVCEYWPAGNIVGQGNTVNAWFRANVQSQINSGQGYNIASATAGASGIGTSLASSVGSPVTTSSANYAAATARPGMSLTRLNLDTVGAIFVLLGCLVHGAT